MSFADWFSRRTKLKSWEKRGSDYIFTLEDGRVVDAWAYFYNAPLGRAERIHSGDYLEHLRFR